MIHLLRVCLYNTDPEASDELTRAIQELNFGRLVAELNAPENLAAALHEQGINLVFFHLDPDPDPIVEVIEQISARYPALAMIAISHKTNPDAILAPMRAGCDQFVCEPINSTDLASAVSRVASKRLLTPPKSRCICVTGASGGTGTTSIACNLALEIADAANRECVLVDLDLQFGDVAVNFDCEPRYNLYDLAMAGSDLDRSVLSSTLTTLPCKVAILSRPEMIEQREAVTPDTIHRVIELLMGSFENTVIDVPRELNPWTAAAFSHAEHIFIVSQLLVPSLRHAKRYYDALLRTGIPEERLEFVVNRSDGRSGRVTVRDLEETVKKPVYACIPNDYQFVARSIDFGRPVASLDRSNPVRAAIGKMARKIISETATQPIQKDERRGFLSRLLPKQL
ncbi:MAG: AAA family ATPase [Phycisphaerales bacterium]|nr:MAG: AAA family ATPase [Phycisphaerales bacterium]